MNEITKETVDRAAQGDRYAIEELYTLTYNDVYRSAKFLLQDEDTVLDIVQDTYVAAFQNLDRLTDRENFRPWVRRIATNKAKDYIKRKKPILFSEMAPEDGGEIDFRDERPDHYPELVLDRKETSRLVREILGTLSEDQRLVIGMFYYEQMSVKEIAEALGCSENTVKSRLNYGRKKVEVKVRDLEKKGTKLYSLAPLPFLISLLALEASAAEIPSATILAAVTAECAAAGTATASAAATAAGAGTKAAAGAGAKAAAGAGVKSALATKIAAGALAVAVAGGTVAAVTSGREKEYTREEVLAAYQEVSAFDERQWHRKQEKYGILHQETVDTYLKSDTVSILYCGRDLDGNGTEELLIASYDDAEVPSRMNAPDLMCIYTFDGERAILALPADPHSLVDDPGDPYFIRIHLTFANTVTQHWLDHNGTYHDSRVVLCQLSSDGFTMEPLGDVILSDRDGHLVSGEQTMSDLEFEINYRTSIAHSLHWEVLVAPRQSNGLQVGDTVDLVESGVIPPLTAPTAPRGTEVPTEPYGTEGPTGPAVEEGDLFEVLMANIRAAMAISSNEYDSDPEVYDSRYARLGNGVAWLLSHRGDAYPMSVWSTQRDLDGDGQAELCIARGYDAEYAEPIAVYYRDGRILFGDALYELPGLFPGEGAPEWDLIEE